LRPGKIKPVIPQKKGFRGQRSKSPEKGYHDQEADPWKIGEAEETRRRELAKVLNNARKELSELGKVTEELKRGLKDVLERADESETKEEAKDFIEDLPSIERINELKRNK
jgi:hypothetical protein